MQGRGLGLAFQKGGGFNSEMWVIPVEKFDSQENLEIQTNENIPITCVSLLLLSQVPGLSGQRIQASVDSC